MELSAALAHYLDHDPWLSEPFTYDDGGDVLDFPPEIAYPLLELYGSGPVTIVENNEENLFVTLDINDYLNTCH